MKGWRLNLEQINTARRLRFDYRMAWRKIATKFGCDAETVRRAIDPDFERAKREVYSRRKEQLRKLRDAASKRRPYVRRPAEFIDPPRPRLEDEDFAARRKVLKSDKAFCDAMRTAIRGNLESPMIGIDCRPSSPDGRFHPSRGLSLLQGSIMGSSAGLCADS